MKILVNILLPAALLAAPALDAGQIAYYPFDGDATDSSGLGHDLTGYAADDTNYPVISASDGKAGGFATFDDQNLFNTYDGENNDTVFVPVTGNAPRSFAMFVRTTAVNSGGGSGSTFFGGWGDPSTATRVRYDLGLHYDMDNQLRNEFNAGAVTSDTNTAINDGEWHHIAAVWDGSEASFYLDGAPYGTATSAALATGTEVGLTLGADTRTAGTLIGSWTNGKRYFEGDMDEVRVYDQALDADAIADLATGDPQLASFSARPAFIAPGQSSTLVWQIGAVDTATIDNGIGDVLPIVPDANGNASIGVSPATTTTYTLTTTRGGVTRTEQATVEIVVPIVITESGFNAFDEFEVTVINLVDGQEYDFVRTTDLGDWNFDGGSATLLDTITGDATGTATLTDATPPAGTGFYRVQEFPLP